ncbi:MAG: DUF1249 domain-containing protein [Chromatiales bacterium]|jgi:uncharacterized protein YqiB (DUF1249 family)
MPVYPWSLRSILAARPTVGALMELCEENYRQLIRLAPSVGHMKGHYDSRVAGHVDLHMEVIEQTPYTSLIHLTYYFDQREGRDPDPDATLRMYHDAAQAEVLDLEQQVLPIRGAPGLGTLDQKWKANLFLSKWLSYCIAQGHKFRQEAEPRGRTADSPAEIA